MVFCRTSSRNVLRRLASAWRWAHENERFCAWYSYEGPNSRLSGTIAGLMLTRAMAALLYGVGANNPATFAFAATLLISVALLACYLPAPSCEG